MKTLTLPDGEQMPVPVPRNEGVEMLYRVDDAGSSPLQRLPIPSAFHARQFLMAVIAEANRLSKEINPRSIVAAAFNCACLGLMPGQQLGLVHFVPFGTTCQLIVGYRGYLELAYGVRFLKDVHCQVLLRDEDFEHWVDTRGPQLKHQLPIERDESWNNVQSAYCIWHSVAGGHGIEVVGRKELQGLYKRAAGYRQSPWHSHPIAMCKKTPLRRAAKTWKQSRELGWAVHLDETADRGESQQLVNPALEPATDDAPPSLSELTWTDPPSQKEEVDSGDSEEGDT